MSGLETEIKFIKGIGPKRALALATVGIFTVGDVLSFYPRRYLDRSNIKKIYDVAEGELITVVGKIIDIKSVGYDWKSARLTLTIKDDTGRMDCTWFKGAAYLKKAFTIGDALAVSGKATFFNGRPQLQHPEYDKLSETDTAEDGEAAAQNDFELFNTGKIIPIYASTEQLKKAFFTNRTLGKLVKKVLNEYGQLLAENLPDELLIENNLMSLPDAVQEIHFPMSAETLKAAQYRLKWSELFFMQILFALRKQDNAKRESVKFDAVSNFTNSFFKSLPFELTDAQKNVVREIRNDLGSGLQMNRLVQGDVGSGKTVVGIFAMMIALDNGSQAAFMSPTEILAEQHYITLKKYLEPLGIKITLLIGKQRKKLREELLASIASGETQIVVGTHALIESNVEFKQLGIVVIDEQHRFGVEQRKRLMDKALNPHVLLMTATPIPRTLSMTLYGDLDVSVINQLPANRKPIITECYPEDQHDLIYERAKAEIRKGRQVYVVYPLVEESEKIDLKNATDAYEMLKSTVFEDCRVGLIHGRLFGYEKEDAMESFRSGKTRVLVATTVIEVGVDVPNASMMIIEHAERFGLSQLHQLRGRVGRGGEQSYCVLMYQYKKTNDAEQRLKVMEDTTDGFRIADEDLKLRGAGNIFGKEQSGMISDLKIANLNEDVEILKSARDTAFAVVQNDRHLRDEKHQGIRDFYLKHYRNRTGFADVG
jgi:ATP-dependent DNA helicase RecG